MIPRHPNCYSKDTEVYTRNGWKLIKDVEVGEYCYSASYVDIKKTLGYVPVDTKGNENKDTFDFEFVKVKRKISGFEKKMIRFSCNCFDVLVTPDHDMYVGKDGVWKFIKAKDIADTARKYDWLSVLFDRNSNLESCYTVYESNEIKNLVVEYVEYNEKIYCVELEKFHTLLVRQRENMEVFCGNCRCVAIPADVGEQRDEPITTITRKKGEKLGEDNLKRQRNK